MTGLDGGASPTHDRGAPLLRRLFGHGSVYTVGSAIQLAAAALFVPILTRQLSPPDYGVLALYMTVFVIGGRIVSLGLPVAITRAFYFPEQGEREARQLATATGCIAMGFGLLCVAAAVAVAGPDPQAAGVIGGLGLLFGSAGMLQASLSVIQAQQRPVAFISVSIGAGALAQVTGLAAIALTEPTPLAYLAGFAFGRLCVSVAAFAGLRPLDAGLPSWKLFRGSLMSLGLPTLPHAIALFLLALGDRFVIQALGTSTDVGRYQVAYSIGSLPTIMLTAFNNAWIAVVYSEEEDERWRTLAQTSVPVMALVAAGLVSLGLASPVLLGLAAPADYDPAGMVLATVLIAGGTAPYVVYSAASQVIVWSGRTRSLAWITPLVTTFNLALVAVLFPPFGLAGAAAATALATLMLAVLTKRAADRTSPGLPWRIKPLLGLGAAGTALMMVPMSLPSDGTMAFARLGLAVAVATLAVVFLRKRMRPPEGSRDV
jgi:O-antigen/teichoic acid export membrane protein